VATKFKGKYPGPDKFKGDKKKIAAWKAAKRKASKPSTPTTSKPKPPLNPSEPKKDVTPAPPVKAPVGADANGGLGLQTNIDIETAVNEAATEKKQAESDAARLRTQALLEERQAKMSAAEAANEARGRTNATTAYRGLRGTTANRKINETETDIRMQDEGIRSARTSKESYADSLVTAAEQNRINTDKWAAGKRLEFTNSQSRNNPTVGTKPVAGGVTAPKPAPEIKPYKDSAKPSVAAAGSSSKTFKGKYPGPDKFKGNKARIAAWKAAKRKVGRK
jgi:hypothetical protein